jgi:hypothetical protein
LIAIEREVSMDQSSNDNSVSAGLVLQFIQRVRRRLNLYALWQGLLWAWLWVSVGLAGWATVDVLRGYQVPLFVYGVAGVVWAATALILWGMWRVNDDTAAQQADRIFGLKDSLRSCRNFLHAGRHEGFYDLQAQQTARQLTDKSMEAIPFRWPRSPVVVAIACTALAVGLAFKGPSLTLVAEEALRRATLQATNELNEELAELVDQLELEVSDEAEKELINANQLREWVKELEATGDPREAMRQYAKLERKIEQAAQALQNRRDEQLLERAAAELKKDPVNRDLADLLKQKKMDQAARELEKMKLMPRERQTGLKLSDQQKELAKLRAAAQRMASASGRDAGRQRDSRGQNSPPQSVGRDQTQMGDQGQENWPEGLPTPPPGDQGPEGGDATDGEEIDGQLDELMRQLEEDLQAWEEAMQKLELADEDAQQGLEGECEACQGRVNGDLDQLGQQLRRLARQRAAQARLRGLAKKFGQAQAQARAGGRGQGDQPGGREAGRGTSDRQRADQDNPETKGRASRLQGLHGQGPSLTQIQAADSGTGISRRGGEVVERDFQRQFESFVEREDIPEDLKSGVKNYFLQIHQSAAPEDQP